MSHNLRFRSNFWRATVFLAVMVGLQLTCTNPRVNLEAGVGPRQDVPGGIPGPHMANSYTFYKYNVSCPTFTVGTGSSFQWDKTGTTLYGQVTGGSEIYFTATPNQAADVYVQYTGNLASLGVPTAQVNITWYCFVYPDGETYAEWQTRENGGAWTTISGTHVTNDDGMSERVYSYSLADLGYDAGTTSLYIRVVGHFAANIYNHQFHVHLFQIGTFWSTISDPATSGNWTNFGTTLPLTVEITRCGSQSGLYNDVYYYRMYYGPNPQVNSTCSYRGAWQNSSSSFPGGGNYGKLFFNVPITPPTRIYYRFYISAASSAEYWSDTYAVDFYDTSAPTYGEPLTFSDSNDTLEIGQPFNISGSAADTGGAGLKNITCFWRIAASPVNKSLFDGIQTQTLTGNAAAFSIQIPAGAFQLNTPTDFILYFYDTFDNENVTSQFEITPQDRTAPTIVPDINATLPISYTKDKRVTFTITEDPVASGVNHSAVYGFYAINNSLFAVASPLANDSHQADDWGYCIQSGNLTYNMTIYVWLKAYDNANNYSWCNLSFLVLDDVIPLVSLNSTASSLVGARADKDILIIVECADGLQGSGISLVRLQFNFTAFTYNELLQVTYNPESSNGNQSMFRISNTSLHAGTLYYIVKVVDGAGNPAFYANSTTVATAPAPPNPPNTPDEGPPDLGWLLPVMVVGIGGVVAVVGLRVRAKKTRTPQGFASFKPQVQTHTPASSTQDDLAILRAAVERRKQAMGIGTPYIPPPSAPATGVASKAPPVPTAAPAPPPSSGVTTPAPTGFKICPSCGNRLIGTAKFCNKCGKPA